MQEVRWRRFKRIRNHISKHSLVAKPIFLHAIQAVCAASEKLRNVQVKRPDQTPSFQNNCRDICGTSKCLNDPMAFMLAMASTR